MGGMWRSVSLLVVLASACTGGSTARDQPARSGSSEGSAFTVGKVPEGYSGVAAGRGLGDQIWGDDSEGTAEPFTVLAPPSADATSDRAVIVTQTGFAGYQGRLGQASLGYIAGGRTREFTLDGFDAVFYDGAGSGNGPDGWGDLLVARGNDLAIRVASYHPTERRLLRILAAVDVTDDHLRAPRVHGRPEGLRVVGSVDADVVLAVFAHGTTTEYQASTTSVKFYKSGDSVVTVGTLPGRSADLAALGGFRLFWSGKVFDIRSHRIAGRPGVLISMITSLGGFQQQVAAYRAEWGDLVLVAAAGREEVPTAEQLAQVAASVKRVR
jgi:hypothetical protein